MAVLALLHHKGGVGTTYLASMLIGALAERGRRVLAGDCDPQGNLSRRMGYEEWELADRPSMAEVVAAATPEALRGALLPCQWEPAWADKVQLIPARIELENRVPEAGVPGSWRRLARALEEARHEYDDVIIDTPPTLGGHLGDLATCAADGILLTTTPTYDSFRGALRIMRQIEDRERRIALGVRAQVIGVVINAKRGGVKNHAQRTDQILQTWGDLVWSPHIPLRADAEDAGERAEPPHLTSGAAGRTAANALADRYLQETHAA